MSQAGPRHGRNPNQDLARHIITGEQGPFDSFGIARDLDDCYINYDNPMEFPGSGAQLFEGDTDDGKNAQNLAEASGLDSGAMADISGVNSLDQFSVDEYNKADDHGPLRSNAGGYGNGNMGR